MNEKNDDLKSKDEPTACTHSAPHPLCSILLRTVAAHKSGKQFSPNA